MIASAWSSNTLRTRNSQWGKYLDYCSSMGLCPLPADCTTVCRFLIVMSRSCKFSTINNYMSAINILHRFYGYPANYRDQFLTKLVLAGLKQRLGTAVEQKIPLTVEQLMEIRDKLPMSEIYMTYWTIIVFGFRTLLRKCNIVPDNMSICEHVILRSDVVFYENELVINVRSSKTNRYKNKVFQIPIRKIDNEWFCVYSLLKRHFNRFDVPNESFLFWKRTGSFLKPILYCELLQFLKTAVTWIGLESSDVGLHSLRRSGAAFLHHIGVPLNDIQSVGDWSSMAVLLYLCTPFSRKCAIERSVANVLENMTM